MRLAEMNAWETAGRGDPEAYRQVEALMNRALDTVLATNPRAEERRQLLPNGASFHGGQGQGGCQGRIQDGVLVTALRLRAGRTEPRGEGARQGARDLSESTRTFRGTPKAA